MANGFAPKISGGIAYTPPVAEPSGLEAIGALANAFVGLSKRGSTKPSENAIKGQLLSPYMAQVEDIMSSDLSYADKQRKVDRVIREGIVELPQYRTEFHGIRTTYGFEEPQQPELPESAEAKQFNEFVATPRGALELNAAYHRHRKEDGSVDEDAVFADVHAVMVEEMQLQVNLDRIKREEETEKLTSNKYWDEFKPSARSLVNKAIPELQGVYSEILEKGSYTITEEMSEALGVPPGEVTDKNAYVFLETYRSQMAAQLRGKLLGHLGVDSNELDPASKGWMDDVLAPLDALIRVAKEDVGSLGKVLSTMQKGDMVDLYRDMDPELRRVISLDALTSDAFSYQLSSAIWERAGISEKIARTIDLEMSGAVTPEGIRESAVRSSTTTAEERLKVTEQALLAGVYEGKKFENYFLSHFANRNRVLQGEDLYMDEETFDAIITGNSKQLGDALGNGEFYADGATHILSDLNMTYQEAKNTNEYPNTDLFINDKGELDVHVFDAPGTNLTDGQKAGIKARVLGQEGAKLLQKKLTVLKTIKGTELIFDAMKMSNQEPEDDNIQGSEGNDVMLPSAEGSTRLLSLVDRTEGGGDYNTLFKFSNRSGGHFANTRVSEMTIGELLSFSKGPYAKWSKEQLGYVATPMGRFQIVGTTLEQTANEMGLNRNTVFNESIQNAMFDHLARKALKGKKTPEAKRSALRGVWSGFKSASDTELDAAIAEFEGTKPPSYTELQKEPGTMLGSIRQSMRPPQDIPASIQPQTAAGTGAGGSVGGTQVGTPTPEATGSQTASPDQQVGGLKKASEQEISVLSDQTKEMLKRMEIVPEDMPSFSTREEMMEALKQGLVKDGDVVLVEGHLEII